MHKDRIPDIIGEASTTKIQKCKWNKENLM